MFKNANNQSRLSSISKDDKNTSFHMMNTLKISPKQLVKDESEHKHYHAIQSIFNNDTSIAIT